MFNWLFFTSISTEWILTDFSTDGFYSKAFYNYWIVHYKWLETYFYDWFIEECNLAFWIKICINSGVFSWYFDFRKLWYFSMFLLAFSIDSFFKYLIITKSLHLISWCRELSKRMNDFSRFFCAYDNYDNLF